MPITKVISRGRIGELLDFVREYETCAPLVQVGVGAAAPPRAETIAGLRAALCERLTSGAVRQ